MQFNSKEYNEILNVYKSECEEIIQELNNNFLELEKTPDNKTPLKKLFQLVHSLKGSSRMLGFNCIQDISHKLEDVLSYWKNDNVIIQSEWFGTIYEICDVLVEYVRKCVKNKKNYQDISINKYLNKLDNLIQKQDIINQDSNVSKYLTDNYIYKKNIDINAIVLELMFVIEKDAEEDSENIIDVIAQNLKELSDIFYKTDYKLIKDKISFLYSKIIDNKNEFDFEIFRQKIPELRTDIYNLYKKLNINSNINKKIQKTIIINQSQEKEENEKNNISLSENFDYIFKNIRKLKYEKDFLIKVTDILKESIVNTDNGQIIEIINKTINLLDILIKKDIVLDNDCYMAVLQSIYLSKRISLKEPVTNLNLTFLLQRLNVLEDMNNTVSLTAKKEVRSEAVPQLFNPKEIININNNIQSIDLQEIKTLRIDSTKLDNLISQTGEMLINGIKSREHINDLAHINTKLIKWHSLSKKMMNYLRYIEKKGIINSETDEIINSFYKKTQTFLNTNAEIIDEINNDFVNIYNMISEDSNKFHQSAAEVETIAKDIRVLPLATIFHFFPRMVRDIAKENNKNVNFIISGSDTIVDKKIIEEIKMPLIHILRNSIYHGIEPPEIRLKNNKDEIGTIKLTAKQADNNIIITIEDDGYGINFAKVKETAINKGLLTEEEINAMNEEQIMKLLFLPGFSTLETVNEISGRGIGLDVVKTKITNLNGDISVDSILNEGCKVTVKLPLSMTTIKAFIILVNNQKYAIPVNAIKNVEKVKREEIIKKDGIECILFEGHTIPIYSISKIFNEKENNCQENSLTVIIIEIQDKQIAFIADKLIGDQEIFQKKLVAPILKIKNINGLTTLPTGEICLIINPYELVYNTDSRKN